MEEDDDAFDDACPEAIEANLGSPERTREPEVLQSQVLEFPEFPDAQPDPVEPPAAVAPAPSADAAPSGSSAPAASTGDNLSYPTPPVQLITTPKKSNKT